jgi:hypothetical protein
MAWRPGPGQKPFALVAVEKERDDLRRTVCALQEEREEATLSAELKVARDDIRVLQGELQTLRLAHEQDASKLTTLQTQVDALRQQPSVAVWNMSPLGAPSPGALPDSGSVSDISDLVVSSDADEGDDTIEDEELQMDVALLFQRFAAYASEQLSALPNQCPLGHKARLSTSKGDRWCLQCRLDIPKTDQFLKCFRCDEKGADLCFACCQPSPKELTSISKDDARCQCPQGHWMDDNDRPFFFGEPLSSEVVCAQCGLTSHDGQRFWLCEECKDQHFCVDCCCFLQQ